MHAFVLFLRECFEVFKQVFVIDRPVKACSCHHLSSPQARLLFCQDMAEDPSFSTLSFFDDVGVLVRDLQAVEIAAAYSIAFTDVERIVVESQDLLSHKRKLNRRDLVAGKLSAHRDLAQVGHIPDVKHT